MCESCDCPRCDELADRLERVEDRLDDVEAGLDEERTERKEDVAQARLEAAETRQQADRAEKVAHTAVEQFRVNADKREESISRFGRLMARIDDLKEWADGDGDGPVRTDQHVDRSEFLSVHRAYMDVRDGIGDNLEANERRAARLFKDVLERGETGLGRIRYDSGQARRHLENKDDMTEKPSGRNKTVSRALETLAIMSKNPRTEERLFEFKQPKNDPVSSVHVIADLDEVKAYLDHVESLLDDVDTDRVVEAAGDGGGAEPDETDETDGPAEPDGPTTPEAAEKELDSLTAAVGGGDAAVR